MPLTQTAVISVPEQVRDDETGIQFDVCLPITLTESLDFGSAAGMTGGQVVFLRVHRPG